MAKAKGKKPPIEDEDQSRRFLETVRELEAAGELSPTGGEAAFERAMQGVVNLKAAAGETPGGSSLKEKPDRT